MKSFFEKCISHITRNMPVYVMIILVFIALCSHLGIPSESLKYTFKAVIKVVSFIAFLFTTIYLFYDVVSTVEGKNGFIVQNNKEVQELEKDKDKLLNDRQEATKSGIVRALENLSYTPHLTKEETDYFNNKKDEISRQQTELRGHNIELWKWKIITLITLNGMFISIAKFF